MLDLSHIALSSRTLLKIDHSPDVSKMVGYRIPTDTTDSFAFKRTLSITMATDANIIHRKDESRFELTLEGGTGILEYRIQGAVMDIHHTFVPVQLRGKSIAAKLAKAAFDYARSEKLEVVPSCSYIAAYAERYPEAGALIQKIT